MGRAYLAVLFFIKGANINFVDGYLCLLACLFTCLFSYFVCCLSILGMAME